VPAKAPPVPAFVVVASQAEAEETQAETQAEETQAETQPAPISFGGFSLAPPSTLYLAEVRKMQGRGRPLGSGKGKGAGKKKEKVKVYAPGFPNLVVSTDCSHFGFMDSVGNIVKENLAMVASEAAYGLLYALVSTRLTKGAGALVSWRDIATSVLSRKLDSPENEEKAEASVKQLVHRCRADYGFASIPDEYRNGTKKGKPKSADVRSIVLYDRETGGYFLHPEMELHPIDLAGHTSKRVVPVFPEIAPPVVTPPAE